MVKESPLDQGLPGVRRASPTSACHQQGSHYCRESRSHKLRSDAVAADGLRSMGQREEGTEGRHRSREISGEGKRTEGGASAAWMRAGGQTHRARRHRKRRLSWSLVTLGEAAFSVSRGARILSPEGDNCPTLGVKKYVTDQGSWPP